MRTTILLLFLFYFVTDIYGQAVTWQKISGRKDLPTTTEIDDNYFIAIRKFKDTRAIVKYSSKDLTQVKRTKWLLLTYSDIVSIINLDGNLFALSKAQGGATYAQSIDPETLELSKRTKLIKGRQNYKIAISEDKSKILFYRFPLVSLGKESIVFVFDKNLELIWTKTLDLDISFEVPYRTQEFSIDNQGNIMASMSSASPNPYISNVLLFVYNKGNDRRIFKIDTKNYMDLYTKYHPIVWSPEPNIIYYFGYYGGRQVKRRKLPFCDGFYYQKFNGITGKVYKPKKIPFPAEYSNTEGAKKILSLFDIVYYNKSTKESIIIATPHFYGLKYSSSPVILKFNEEMNLEWCRIINFKQKITTLDNSKGITHFTDDFSNIFVLYNDNIENINLRNKKKEPIVYRKKHLVSL